MFNIFKNFLDYNQKEVNRLQKKVDEINSLEDLARKLKDPDFKKETEKLKKQLSSGEKKLDEILPWAYALVREAARRVLGLRHFDEQFIAGIALHEGKIAEQKTGEGKTLSATAPLYLNALTGRGVHLVTVNDYLARRDAGWMGQVFSFMGVSVSAIISDASFIYDPEFVDSDSTDWRLRHLRPVSRKEAYEADITYGINSEFGFDYLRDNMAYSKEDLKQRGFHFAIIDEVDSVLIDEARTPHIISAPYDEDTSKYYDYARIAKGLDEKDYIIDEKLRTVHLSEEGLLNIEKMLGIENIYEKDYDTLFHVEAALKAKVLFNNNKEYIVKDGEIIIVDEFTGRLLYGRRFSEGIHQAIEAKENVAIKRESRTLATVSLQNYFRMYEKLAGMTGTAATEAEEFAKIYKLEVITVPTHQQMVRRDHSDLIYRTEKGKFQALAEEIAKEHKIGRPVLVGTTSIEKNEQLSMLLKKKGIPHNLLNAKNHEKEAQIIADAGKFGAVTVATNMAGRGVDIVLGGETPSRYEVGSEKAEAGKKEFEKEMEKWNKMHDEVISVGGLFVIGTERHESRRIDNQLRGRAGRQGDPGETRFFVSLEDDLMRIFGGEQISKLMTFFKIPEDQPLEHSMVSKAIEQAQTKVEGFNFDIRKHLVEYDDVLNKQREILYKLRRQILLGEFDDDSLDGVVFKAFEGQITDLVNFYGFTETEPNPEKLAEEVSMITGEDKKKLQKELEKRNTQEWQESLIKNSRICIKRKKKSLVASYMTRLCKICIFRQLTDIGQSI
jgi:preprotein translocase subunit SecA